MLKSAKSPSEMGQAQLTGALKIMELSLENTERMIRLQMSAARRMFEENTEMARALTHSQNAQELLSLRVKLASQNAEALLAESHDAYQAALQTRKSLIDLVNMNLGELGKEWQTATEQVLKATPGGETQWVSVQTMISAANTAAETLARLAAQAVDMIETGFAEAGESVTKPRAKTTPRKRT